ncbi:MAG: LLM class F420-dependent oxidoreductase [Acidimicrobiia bacterium]
MPTYGYFLSTEEYAPAELVEQAVLAERAGFEALWISDHFHPWNDEQGQAPFVWGVIGAIAQATSLPITTAVTCPTIRIHPAIVAQAAATSALLTGGRFTLGVGTGENLNEHVLGDRWPPVDIRLEMLEEAVEVMRWLWTGEQVTHRGRHYTVENARLYSLPDEPVPVYVSAFGPKAMELAARIGDGYCGTSPDPDLVGRYRELGGSGPRQGGMKMCWGADRDECVDTVHRLWGPNSVPGELSQELPMPAHFEQAGQLVTKEMVGEKYSCGPDLDEHLGSFRSYAEAGYDEIYVSQIGGAGEDYFRWAEEELLPALRR